MDSKSKKTSYCFTVDNPEVGLLQMHFDDDICYRLHDGYPVCFHAEQITEFNLDDPEFSNWYSPVAMALVEHLIRDGSTGISIVVVSSRKGIKIIYDPFIVQNHRLKDYVRQIINYVDDYGWPTKSD
jgi:hypothetical protein